MKKQTNYKLWPILLSRRLSANWRSGYDFEYLSRTLHAVLSLKLTLKIMRCAQANICLQDDQRPKDDKYMKILAFLQPAQVVIMTFDLNKGYQV
jgi:hypothetical protein